MGKKSRRNRNKKTGHDAASATAIASAIASATDSATAIAASSAGSGTNQCFHGSTAGKFHPKSEYMKAAKEYVEMLRQEALLDNQDGSKKQQALAIRRIYDEDHMYLIKDPEFCRFVFAFSTKKYLESNNLKDKSRGLVIRALLHLGLFCRYRTTPKELHKYDRDIRTDRGIIKVLVRETKTHCKCMNEGKVIAKTMDINGKCHGCLEEFPKETLSFCDGCQLLKYHNRECQINHWHIHKSDCKRFSESNAKV
ncbi:hypothetical protein FRACYDRAFT_250310 [Fragilariopsis cylindrus CCMP1102]|uniref:MYND-type domain-containing protein n=1 Tax=Fragilariopsis cylindrus CCMP1102 TaxID=635003 RepID=A0A1E7EQA2_9STRA|nr:hypothetical protein FRACYDRAFT_250310 [Fragilariopsis cylindrus CCMP1102]|eukprot:OEU08089.1 hypothetical protein FRACYDRAFT_250310 [Fragilariopsis cylindrus CCMP1102]